eukprot:Hpha_TRINITY_DN3119_c0_g1::TRINITY_DN3119_c0_g1_i1::g.96491::m.96491/K20301/TRAPPC2, TRS20; trafficking protein particle complex subunit 2
MPPILAGVCVVSRHGSPLFVKVCPEGTVDELTLHSALLAALDPAERAASEKAVRQSSAQSTDNKYLGCVLQTGDCRVHAHTANTKVKLFAVVCGEARDTELRALLRQIHELYTQVVCDPFYELETPIRSVRFARAVELAIRSCAMVPVGGR